MGTFSSQPCWLFGYVLVPWVANPTLLDIGLHMRSMAWIYWKAIARLILFIC